MSIVDNAELIAAILTAGMLPSVQPLKDGSSEDEKRIVGAVGHAISLYAAVLEGLHCVEQERKERCPRGF